MKPPPRTRTKPNRNLKPELVPQGLGKVPCKWQRAEQRKLLTGLKRFSRTVGGHEDIDYAFLRKQVPTRSILEIQSVVETLKNKVISCASLKLKKKRWEDNQVRKPIEVWTHMASAVAGTLEEPISGAFSQMLTVSSTEPRTLRNCDPPLVRRPPTDEDRPVGRTVPFRPMSGLPVQGEHPGTNTARPLLVLKTPAPTIGPAKRLSAPSRVVRMPISKILPPQEQPSSSAGTSPAATYSSQTFVTSNQPGTTEILVAPPTTQPASQTVIPITGQAALNSNPISNSKTVVMNQSVDRSVISTQQPLHLTTTSSLNSTSSSPHTPLSSSAASPTPLPSTAPSSVTFSTSATSSCSSTHVMPPPAVPAVACHDRFGHNSKCTTTNSPRTFGVKCVVDFERLYRYLSVIHKPNEECHLTHMESAIMLNLLMSLPEAFSLLDCNKLRKHLIQVYQCLSSPANSKMAKEMFKDLKDGHSAETEVPNGQASSRTDSQHNSARTVDNSDSGGRKLQRDDANIQSSRSNNTSSQSGNANIMELCPPLNPFMVPLKLLMRR